MIFKRKKKPHPFPKKGYSVHIQRLAPQTGSLAAKLHPIPAAQSGSFCQDLPPLYCLGQLPKSPRCSLPQLSESTKPIWNCLNPNIAPPSPPPPPPPKSDSSKVKTSTESGGGAGPG